MSKARLALFLIASACFSVAAYAQTMNYYKFKDKFVDLSSNRLVDSVAKTATIVQRETTHAAHFGVDESLQAKLGEAVYTLNKSRAIVVSDAAGGTLRTIEDPDRAIRADHIAGNMALFAVEGGVLRLIRLEGKHGYVLRRYSPDGVERGKWQLAHTIYKTQGNVTESIPHLYYFAHTASQVIFSSMSGRGGEAVILDLKDGNQKRLPYRLAGIVVSATDRSLAGWVSTEDSGHKLSVEIGPRKFTIADESSGDAVKAVLANNTLYLAHYHNIATGCGLSAYDINTGKRIWRADVKQLMVGHSEYYNLVYLTLAAGRLILEANEAAGAYLQIFDPATGRRLFDQLPSGG